MGKKFMGLGGTDHFWDRAKAWILNQITSAVAAKIAEVVANAPEDLDTLKEIADWIKTHANDAAAMNTQITENKSNIATNTSDISALKTSVAGKADKVHTHSAGDITSGTLPIANGGTGVTTQADINKAFIGNLETGESDVTDGTEFVSSYATDNGFAETADGAVNKPYKRQFVKVWNYIKGKISSVLGLTKDSYGGKAASAGNADTVDNYHASDLWRKDGGTWNPNANISLGATANGDEWSFDISRNGHTGCYWHVWDSSHGSLLRVNADDGKVSAPYGFVGNLSGKASTAGTADNANKLNSFAYWGNPYDYDSTNGVRPYVYKITMAAWFTSILVQIYDDINYARSRKYFLGLWHVSNYGYNVSVTDLGGTKNSGLRVWMGNDGNVYLQADVYWTSRISFSYLDDISDVTITKIGSARYGSNTDINGNVLFTPLTDPIIDCGALRADHMLSSASREPQILKTDILFVSNKLEASNKMIIPIGAPSSLEDGCIWIER